MILLAAPVAAAERYDLLIRGGTIYDGTGKPGYVGDIAVHGGRIAAVGKHLRGKAAKVIEAQGLAVTPGFIDAHSHVDFGLETRKGPMVDDQDLVQGVTTIVMGPDGYYSPENIKQRMAQLKERGSGVNYSCYIGHNGIREQVMPGIQRPANGEETAAMAALVREGMEMGCVGLSTGLMYEPGMYSDTREVVALAEAVKSFGGTYDSHTRDPSLQMLKSEKEAIEIGRRAGIPAKLGHLKATGLINKGRIGDVITAVEEARASGQEVVADQYPYDGAATGPLSGIFVLPGRKDMPSAADVRASLKDPKMRAVVRALTEHGEAGGFSWVKAVGYGNMRIVDAPGAPELVDQNIELLAKAWGMEPFDLVARLVQDQPDSLLITLGTIDEADVQKLIVQPWVMIASDGGYSAPEGAEIEIMGYHPRATGSFARVLGHYSRDLKLLPLAEAVRKMSGLPAAHLHLTDRGFLKPGLAADIAVFDPAKITARSTYAKPAARAEGMVAVIVNGETALEDGKVTGTTVGRFVPRGATPSKR
jgi:N-acyl-D-aspartate/D-glutamate deacylase